MFHRNRPDADHGSGTDHELEDHDRGLAFDLETLVSRRRALTLIGGAGLVAAAAACQPTGDRGGSTTTTTTTTATSGSGTATTTAAAGSGATTTTTGSTSVAEIPDETAGPYPGDGSNGPDVLTQSGIVRSDIRSSFGSYSGTAQGVPNTVRLKVLSLSNGVAPLVGGAVYLWHCTREGGYSLYSQGVTDQNFLRGVQETDANGEVTFTSIFPAAYDGRWPHIHFEVYPSLDAATSAGSKLKTSQLAFPKDVCDVVYATSGYGASVSNLARTSLSSDMVFRDGYSSQLATVTGDVANGYLTTLTLAV